MAATLFELSHIISNSVGTLDKECRKANHVFPGLDDAFSPHSEAFRSNPAAAEAAKVLAAAALQIAAMAMAPQDAIFTFLSGHFKSAALRCCTQANVTEILREAGSEGLHVDKIAAMSGICGMKLGRLIRYLATHNVYKELSPNVFTNNRLSSTLDTGKSVSEIFADPEAKYENTNGFAALAAQQVDEITKSSAYLWENLSDPASAFSGEVASTALNRAFGHDMPIWAWYETPEQSLRMRRFSSAMRGVAAMESAERVTSAFDWKSLPKDSFVVDVGGGVGTSSLSLAKAYPDLHIVIQDRPPVIEEAKKLWNMEMPEALQTGRVILEVHDYFTPQPDRNVSVFLLKQVMHDWADIYARKLLSQLYKAARPDTRLLLVDSIMPFACHSNVANPVSTIKGAIPREALQPLLANYGAVNEMGYNADLTMLVAFNSQERTIKNLEELLASTGWKPIAVHRMDGGSNFLQPIEAVPGSIDI